MRPSTTEGGKGRQGGRQMIIPTHKGQEEKAHAPSYFRTKTKKLLFLYLTSIVVIIINISAYFYWWYSLHVDVPVHPNSVRTSQVELTHKQLLATSSAVYFVLLLSVRPRQSADGRANDNRKFRLNWRAWRRIFHSHYCCTDQDHQARKQGHRSTGIVKHTKNMDIAPEMSSSTNTGIATEISSSTQTRASC